MSRLYKTFTLAEFKHENGLKYIRNCPNYSAPQILNHSGFVRPRRLTSPPPTTSVPVIAGAESLPGMWGHHAGGSFVTGWGLVCRGRTEPEEVISADWPSAGRERSGRAEPRGRPRPNSQQTRYAEMQTSGRADQTADPGPSGPTADPGPSGPTADPGPSGPNSRPRAERANSRPRVERTKQQTQGRTSSRPDRLRSRPSNGPMTEPSGPKRPRTGPSRAADATPHRR